MLSCDSIILSKTISFLHGGLPLILGQEAGRKPELRRLSGLFTEKMAGMGHDALNFARITILEKKYSGPNKEATILPIMR